MRPLIIAAIWLAVFGTWPLDDPGHAGDTPASLLDLALHALAVVFIIHWLATRQRAPKENP